MEGILRSLGMETILGRFQAQRMDPQATLAAFYQELVRLGVSTIGDRIRLRDACKSKVEKTLLRQAKRQQLAKNGSQFLFPEEIKP